MWWSRLVTDHPIATIVSVLALNCTLTLVSVMVHPLPSFDDPLVGFEVRGTPISNRLNAWKLLIEETTSTDRLRIDQKINTSPESALKDELLSEDEELKHIEDMQSKPFGSLNHDLSANHYFCGPILEDYSQIVLTSANRKDLFSSDAIKTLCQIDRQLLRFELNPNNIFKDNCETKNSTDCCKSWSLHNYVLVLANKTSCNEINESDVSVVKKLLERCAPFYHKLQLNADCQSEPSLCRKAPPDCFKGENAVFNIMNFLVDYHFLNPNNPNQQEIHYTNIFLPIAKSTKLLDYFNALSEQSLKINDIEVVAMDLGLKHVLFDKYLMRDSIYLVIAFAVILISLYAYTGSMIVTLVTIAAMVTSLGSTYFFYTMVFRMPFFPFMNLLSIVIAIGIGSDNALIYCKVWGSAKSDKNDVMFLKLVSYTLSHSWVSMLAASATTCCALFAGYLSDITSLKCFSVFASTWVAINFFVTLLTLPSAIIISEQITFKYSLMTHFWRCRSFVAIKSKFFFERLLSKVILKLRLLIALIFSAMAIVSVISVTHYPKLQLPDSHEFQIFSAKHFFERYDLEMKNEFWFKRVRDLNDNYIYYMPIRVVFGVEASDNGNPLDPFSRGSLQLISNFDVSSERSQLWIIKLCKELRSQSFYRPTIGPLLSNCFIETFKDWMENRECIDPIDHLDRSPCCRTSVFPYKPSVFTMCLEQVIRLLAKTPNYYLSQDWAGPRFDKKSLQMVAAIIEYDSNYTFSYSFTEMNKFWNEINDWISHKMLSAPEELQNGWFVSSQMDFYALQLSLSEGTLKSIAFSLFFSLIALTMTTCDLRLSILSLISISSIIFSTIALLVILGWKLNVLESISISLAIGLAIDFTLHYTIAFKITRQQENRENDIRDTLRRIGSPVAMAALTTCSAGVFMLLSTILAYVRIGVLLIVLSLISYFYSTFFHLSSLSLFGSWRQIQTNSMPVSLNRSRKFTNSSNMSEPTPRTTETEIIANRSITNTALTLSTSSTATDSSMPNECHELDKMI